MIAEKADEFIFLLSKMNFKIVIKCGLTSFVDWRESKGIIGMKWGPLKVFVFRMRRKHKTVVNPLALVLPKSWSNKIIHLVEYVACYITAVI